MRSRRYRDVARWALAKDYAHLALSPGLPATEAPSLREAKWQQSLDCVLAAHGKSDEEVPAAGRFVPGKTAVALQVREESGAAVPWLAARLGLGTLDSARPGRSPGGDGAGADEPA